MAVKELKKDKKKPPTIALAQELHVDTDLRRLIDGCAKLGEYIGPFTKRLRVELSRVKDGIQAGVPNVPLFMFNAIPYTGMKLLFGSILSPYPYLRTIQLHHCSIGDDGVLKIVEFIKEYKPSPHKNPFGIECLELPGCLIGAKGASYLASLMSSNETIQRCVLDFNPLEDKGAAVFSDGLRWNGTLKELSLQYCKIGPTGAAAIAKGAVKSSNVTNLHLRGNMLGPQGVRQIADALSIGVHLQEVDLADTCFGGCQDTLEALCNGVERSVSLSSVNIDFNVLTPAGASSIVDVLTKNRKITRFVVSERLDPALHSKILASVEANSRLKKKRKVKKLPQK